MGRSVSGLAGCVLAPWPECHIVQHIEVLEEQTGLRHQPDPPLVGGHFNALLGVGQDMTIEPHLPAVGNEQPGRHLQDRRFASRIGADHREPTALGNLKRHFDVPGVDPEINRQPAHGCWSRP